VHLNAAILDWLILAALLSALCWIVFAQLRTAGYCPVPAATIALLTFAQPAFAGATIGTRSAVFVAAIYATGRSAVAFVHRQDPRRIVLLGSSLAGAQFVHPVWGAAVSLILPVALGRSLAGENLGRVAGLCLSLLFIPALAATTLIYFSAVRHLELPHWPPASVTPQISDRIALCVLAAFMATPLFLARIVEPVPPSGRIVSFMYAMLVTVSVAFSAFGHNQLLECAAAASSLLVLMVMNWSQSPKRASTAMLLVGGNFALCWMLLLAETEFLHVQ
jgi:hypothetical protein